MRAAAVALVLILGAAVVLWYGNLLNSWILGGLVGGLAALLLSIPISLAIFSYFSHRQDEKLRAEAEEEQARISPQAYYYQEVPAGYELAYAQQPLAEEEWSEEDEYIDERYATNGRNLPVPYTRDTRASVERERQRLLPVQPLETSALQQRQRVNDQLLKSDRRANHSPAQMPASKPTPARRPIPGSPAYSPGFYAHQSRSQSQRGLQQTAALRIAREEAMRRQYPARREQNWDAPSSPASQKLPAVRSETTIERSIYQQGNTAASRRLPSQQQTSSQSNQYRARRTVEGTTVPPRTSPMLPPASNSNGAHRENTTSTRSTGGLQRGSDPQTEKLGGQYPQTEQLAGRQFKPPFEQTEPLTRNPHIEARSYNADLMTGTLKKPLVRRAPYMYEDDPLLHELAQQIEAPTVRRSSRPLD